ncbi:MAG: glycosyltransferase [Pirellulales bacterium]|nr:glycosyltransferase [Pirellulales bacterium]
MYTNVGRAHSGMASTVSPSGEIEPLASASPSAPVENEGEAGSWDAEYLRGTAWEISERRPADAFAPLANHVALAMVHPCRGFAHWRISHEWIDDTSRRRADVWRHCRMVLRLYDVSYITFDGLNANRVQDHPLPGIRGQMFFDLPHAGSWQLAEVGFLLSNGEFIPAARSHTVSFPRASASSHGAQDALLVDDNMQVEPIGNLWDQENILKERRSPKLRRPLHIAVLCLTLDQAGPPEFIRKLATGLGESGHDVHVLAPASDGFTASQTAHGVHFHPIDVRLDGELQDVADAFRRAAQRRLAELPPLDVMHVHEWLAGTGLHVGDRPTVCSFTSLESTRRNGTQPDILSSNIEETERQVARAADVVLVPGWLRETAVKELRVDAAHVHGFAMEGRLPNEWESPLDFGQVKREIGLGPMDRLLLFIGPLEHAAGPDILLEALPVVLQRAGNPRIAFAGGGELLGALQHRARELAVDYAVRFLGHVERQNVNRLLRASEALVLPSRYRVPLDDAVVDLARLAGRPVVTTHGGPAHLVRHEETGIITYDNPGSMVWALDRVLGDPANAQRMGENNRRNDSHTVSWNEVAGRYLEICAASFPQLSETQS